MAGHPTGFSVAKGVVVAVRREKFDGVCLQSDRCEKKGGKFCRGKIP